jgi:hypothetical protein
MYEVKVNADPERFLHWDRPLSEQHPEVQKALRSIGAVPDPVEVNTAGHFGYSLNEFKTLTPDHQRELIGRLPVNHANYAGDPPGYMAFNELGQIHRDPAAVSQALKDAGIPGIRYLDQGSRGAGEGTSNSVVFDANNMEIIRRYGLAGLMAGGGAAAMGGQQRQQQ